MAKSQEKRSPAGSGLAVFVSGGLCAFLSALVLKTETLLPLLGEKEVFFSHDFPRNTTRLPHQEDIDADSFSRTTVTFMSQGTMIEAWCYMPKQNSKPAPVIIMGHGLGSQKDMGLVPYAEQFAQAGMAVLVFDYRGFGGSDGFPRHHISWRKHLEDYSAALNWVAAGNLPDVDAKRIALWGVSYSGGHALMTAAQEENKDKVSVVIANEPFLSGDGNIGKAIKERGIVKVLRLLLATVLDKLHEVLNISTPLYVKLVGSFDELALLNMDPVELSAARGASPGQLPTPPARIGGWKNLATPRMILDNMLYKPLDHVHKISCPTLLVGGTKDVITPLHHVERAKSLIGDKATLLVKPWSHIELHKKFIEPQELAPVIDYLRLHLQMRPMHVETEAHESNPELGYGV